MLRVALSALRYRATTFVAGFLAVLAGAAIVLACGGLMETGVRAEVAPQRLSAAALVVTGDQSYASESANEWARLDAGTLATVRAVPGVAGAVSDISFPVALLADGRLSRLGLQGHGWASAALTPYGLKSGAPPQRGEVVVDAGLAGRLGVRPGDRVRLVVAGRVEAFRLSGTAVAPAGLDVPPQHVFFSAADAARLYPHRGEVDSIGVLAEAGTDLEALAQRVETRLARQHPGAGVLTGDRRGVAEHPEANVGANRLRILAGVFSGWTVLVTVFGVASMVVLSVRQRRGEIALLRAIGSTARQIRVMIVAETLTLALLATVVAYLPGRALGRWLFDLLTDNGVATPVLKYSLGWVPSLIGGLATVLAALVAALIAGRQASRTQPVQAIAEAAYSPHRLGKARVAAAVFFLLGGISQAVVTVLVMTGPLTAATAGPASVFVAVGLALLAPSIVRFVIGTVGSPLAKLTGAVGELAVQQARAQPAGLAAALAPVIMLTGVAAGTLYLQETENAALQRVFHDNLSASLVVTSATGGFRPDVVERIRELPGVEAASEFVVGSGRLEAPADNSQVGGWKVHGVNGPDAVATTTIRPSAGDLRALVGETAAIPERAARAHDLRLGDPVTVRLGDGTRVRLRLVAFFPADRAGERIVVPASLLARHTTTGLPAQILVQQGDGVAVPRLARTIAALGTSVPGLHVADRGALDAAQSNLQRMLASANYAVVAMLVGFAALSVVNSLVAATANRRRDFGLLRLSGATRTQVLGSMSIEALLVAVLGIVLGSLASTATLVPFALVKNASPLPSGPPSILLAIAGLVLVLTMSATLVPTWNAMRQRAVHTTHRTE